MSPPSSVLLMVEDEQAIVELVTMLATPLGLQVVSVPEGGRMVERVAALRPAVVTLDFVLADGDGLRALRELRALPEFDAVPVLVLTAINDTATLKSAYAAGANDFISKPFNVDLLDARLRMCRRMHQLNEQLRERAGELEAERAHRAGLSRAARAFAHEVRNPLLAIGAAAQVFAHHDADQRRRQRMARAIEGETQRIAGLVREYVERQEPPGASESVDVLALCSDVIDLNLVCSPAHSRVTVEVAGGVPRVRGNGPRLKQVLLNLLLNAATATEQGGAITLRAEPATTGVQISVIDTGHGIAPADLPRIFDEAFTRTGSDGLGLTIARRIVEEHGGVLRVESQPGQGSTFSLWLPAT